MARPLNVIAQEAFDAWPAAQSENHPAGAYLIPMLSLQSINEWYGMDSADSIVRYFLSNAAGWRGPKAREIKAELKALLK